MKFNLGCLCFFCMILFSCNEAAKSVQEKDNTKAKGGYRHFEGSMGNTAMTFDFIIGDSTVSGYFCPDSSGQPITIIGNYQNDSVKFSYSLSPMTDQGTGTDIVYYFAGKLMGELCEGVWSREGAQHIVQLKENYNHSHKFEIYRKEDSTLDPHSGRMICRNQISIPECENEVLRSFINPQMFRLLADSSVEGGVADYISKKVFCEIPTDKEELAHMLEFPTESINDVEILYNKNDRLVLAYSWYIYSGGAHGMNGIYYSSLDLKNRRVLQLADVLSEKQRKNLPAALESAFRRSYGLSATDSLNTITFDSKPEFVNDNYYITEKGIGFQYNPYEIAPYAVGSIALYVSFEELNR